MKYAGTPRVQSILPVVDCSKFKRRFEGGICALVPPVIIGKYILPRAYKNVNFSVLNVHVLGAEAIEGIVREIAKCKKYVFIIFNAFNKMVL